MDPSIHDDAAAKAPGGETRFGPAGGGRGSSEDLSARVALAVERQPGDTVRCTRVGEDRYRCNWWSALATGTYDNPGMSGLLVTTHRVRKSLFLRAALTRAGLAVRLDAACATNRHLSADDRRVLPGGAAVIAG
jgi:hypothetical protein